MKEKSCNQPCRGLFSAAVCFIFGFLTGAALVAILDYRDEKIARLYKLRRDTNENYIYSE